VITRAGGVKQVTLNGYPLYYYAGDMAPGQAKGNGEGGVWHVIKIKMKSASTGTMANPASSATPSSTPTSGSGGGGYGY